MKLVILIFSLFIVIPILSIAQISGTTGGLSHNNTANALIAGGTKFTTSGGGCTVTATKGGAMAGSFTTSTTGTCTTTITMNGATGFTAPNGWICSGGDVSSGHEANLKQTGESATTAVIAVATTSGDTVAFGCIGY